MNDEYSAIDCVVLAAGGHACSVIDAAREEGRARAVAIVDARPAVWGSAVLGVPVVGGDEQLPYLAKAGIGHFINGMGSSGSTAIRTKLYEAACQLGLSPVGITHPTATISPAADRGTGVQLMARSVVGPRAKLGCNVLVNTGAIIEHDCTVGDHVHVASAATLTGGVSVGSGAHIGAGATVLPGVTIGVDAVVAAGAVVIEDVPDGVTVMGVPAKTSWRKAA